MSTSTDARILQLPALDARRAADSSRAAATSTVSYLRSAPVVELAAARRGRDSRWPGGDAA
ncbi:MAG: hypothetical protein M3P91_01945 [Actinomycetota bacterium]|nr:hypothetical protein [Actinomycetota bacterium]